MIMSIYSMISASYKPISTHYTIWLRQAGLSYNLYPVQVAIF